MNLKKSFQNMKKRSFRLFDRLFDATTEAEYIEAQSNEEAIKRDVHTQLNKCYINHTTHMLNQYTMTHKYYDVNYTSRIKDLIEQLHSHLIKDVVRNAQTHAKNATSLSELHADYDFIKWVKEV